MKPGPRIYNLFPLLVGPIAAWSRHLPRISAMNFDWLFLNPFHRPGFSGSIYAVKDYDRLNPLFRGDSTERDEALLARFVAEADAQGLSVMMDLVLNHTSKDSLLAEHHPTWFRREHDGSLRSPHAVDPDDPTKITVWGDLAEIDYGERPEREATIRFWADVICKHAALGMRGFRADAAYKVPAIVWRRIIEAVRAQFPETQFFAETLGCRPHEVVALHDAGFDFIFNSAKWWDFKAPWLAEQYEIFRHIAPSIAFPESHDTERLASDLRREGLSAPADIEAVYRQRYLFAATFSTGVMMPIGYEYGFARKLDVVRTRPGDWETPLFDISAFIAAANRMKASVPALNEEGPQTWLQVEHSAVLSLFRESADDAWALTVINPDRHRGHDAPAHLVHDLDVDLPGREVTPDREGAPLARDTVIHLEPAEVRVFMGGQD